MFSGGVKDFKATVVDGYFECAVFYNQELDYTTPITNDVLRNLNDPELQNVVEQIQRLPEK